MQYWTREVPWTYVQRMLADGAWFEDPEYDPKTGKPKEDDFGPEMGLDDGFALLDQISKIKK